MQTVAADQVYQDFDTDLAWEEGAGEAFEAGLSFPTILLTAALSIATVGGAFYLMYMVLGGTLLTSAVLAGLILLVLFTPLGILCARLTGTSVLLGNLGWGCGLMVMMLLFFGICGISGALAALLVQVAGLSIR